MKKFCFLLCCVLLFQHFAACSRKNEEIKQPVNFYYVNKEVSYNTPDGVICPEIREGDQIHSLEDLLCVYFQGPNSSDLQSLLPKGTALHSCIVEGEMAIIHLSSQFSELSGVKLATVCSAILLTAHDYAGTQTICVRSENSKLDDKDEFVLSLDDVVFIDTVTSEEPKE